MHTLNLMPPRRSRPNPSRRNRRGGTVLEPLESRQLLSAWTTVDALPKGSNNAMSSDSAGNVYAAGSYIDPSGASHRVVREQLAGSATWLTIEDLPGATFNAISVDDTGNLFVGGNNASGWAVWERRAGGTAFSVVDQLTGTSGCTCLAIDAAGDVFAAGSISETTPKSKTTYDHWVVREEKAGQSAFTTVDDFSFLLTTTTTTGTPPKIKTVTTTQQLNIIPNGITVINSGPNTGIYVAGGSLYGEWVVRKSTTGTASSWSSVDSQYLGNGVGARGIAADAAGNLYVMGGQIESNSVHWITKKSTDGGITWTIEDDYQLESGQYSVANAVGTDAAGNVYVVGYANGHASDGSLHRYATIRSNVGGTWHIVDQFSPAVGGLGYNTLTTDIYGNLYAGGAMGLPGSQGNSWITRELSIA